MPTDFPVLWQGSRDYQKALQAEGCPRTVPWGFIAEHRDGCLANHDQTPERLAERGGLGPEEMVAVIEANVNWAARKRAWAMPPAESVPRLKELLAAWASASTG